MNYRDLLKKYMAMVLYQEGVTMIENIDQFLEFHAGFELTGEEVEELKKISDEVYD